jgi:hypothetical protein
MASATWQGRFGLTHERARKRAAKLDARTHEELRRRLFGPPPRVFREIRAYLIRRSAEMRMPNNPIQLVKLRQDQHGMALIVLGPTLDKGSTPDHFHFDSGARLSFGLTLREHDNGSLLISYRFHYHLPERRSPAFFRFDLNDTLHEDSLAEPRCHLHPGLEDVRIPLYLYDPISILDQIFFVLEKAQPA